MAAEWAFIVWALGFGSLLLYDAIHYDEVVRKVWLRVRPNSALWVADITVAVCLVLWPIIGAIVWGKFFVRGFREGYRNSRRRRK